MGRSRITRWGAAILCAAASFHSVSAQDSLSSPPDIEVLRAAQAGRASELRELLSRGGNPEAVASNGLPVIAYALSSGDAATVEVLLQARPSVANQPYQDPRGLMQPPLVEALLRKQPGIVKVLIQAGADVHWRNAENFGLLEMAVYQDDKESLQALVAGGADPQRRLRRQSTLLHGAVARNQLEIVKLLLDYGIDPNHRDDSGITPLAAAAYAGNVEIAAVLLERGAWVYPIDTYGYTALGRAQNHIKDPALRESMVKLLQRHGARFDADIRPIDATYLAAVHRGDLSAVKATLAEGADIDARRPFTLDLPITEAPSLAVAHPSVLAYLLERGIAFTASDHDDFTALHAAARVGNVASIELLIKRGLDVNQKTRFGNTPLSVAVYDNQPAAVEALLRLGADVSVRAEGLTLLQLAHAPHRSKLIAPMLEKAGAKP